MFPLLPQALVAFILASPTLAVPTSFNDPFKALSARVVKPPEPPICCLTPLSPTEPVQDDVLLSFEEWKEKRISMDSGVQDRMKEREGSNGEHATESGEAAAPAAEVPSSPATPQDAPHFRVPVTDRFNYAGLDCSARVHTSHKSAKSPASILSSKRDRYMLSPCRPPKGESQFIVVELCEDIRIDTVQLANFEFFSGVFKDFTVSVSKTYTTDPEGWTFASTHTAKNIRVVQSFHPPTSLRDFYRYIRIDFHSHYSNEYYCPISLLRVYGLTHLEEYKWDIWETESRARGRRDEQQAVPSPPVEVNEPEPAPLPDPVRLPASYAEYMDAASTEREQEPQPEKSAIGEPAEDSNSHSAPDVDTAPPSNNSRGRVEPEPVLPATYESSEPVESISTPTTIAATAPDQTPPPVTSEVSSADAQVPHSSTKAEGVVLPNGSDPTPAGAVSAPAGDSSASSSITSATSTITTTSTSATSASVVSVSAISTTSLVPAPAGGESIYRTIMNRLTALEANHTLYARYVEEHTGAVREMLRRVGEDLGRAEGAGKAQAQTYSRTLLEWERQRKRVDAEYRELMRRVEYLSDEIVLEKRLGIAQLLLLLAVLVFMTLTRGSRGEPVMVPSVSRSALRAWGRRHLSLKSLSGRSGSGDDWDWVGRLKSRSRSRSPSKPAVSKPKEPDPPIKLEFPSVDEKPIPHPIGASKPKPPRLNLHMPAGRPRSRTRSIGNNTVVFDAGPRARSRTPTLMRTPHRRPATPVHAHALSQQQHSPAVPSTLPMTHSVSHGSHAPRSARRWARTAHLHELRGGASGAGQASVPRGAHVDVIPQRDSGIGAGGMPHSAGSAGASVVSLGSPTDVFASPSPVPSLSASAGGAFTADLLGMGLRASGSRLLFHGLSPSTASLDLAQMAAEADDAGDGDMWVDTDEGSEVGGDGAVHAEAESPWLERAEPVAAAA
ncbi:UNC-like C-terminal-domain-containing protein [Mycena alexandri]|uniref:UNC-like C-terminal-domain-containing protein n=1 Tax=Mycena alexandri TaxID=1745969 RepID=A0AAD6TJG9_9AGAR|nr:UNC-like C-terminal-domain-containing protein [Mycena alexandri]